jgi:alpha-beta hydrolase superfamily lysophospholipase
MHFTISSDEDLPIRGTFDIPERPRALVVVVHGFKGFKEWGFFPWLAHRLAAHRLAVCRFNMSRSGIGQDPESFDRLELFEDDTYSVQLRDLRAVVEHAHERFPDLPIVLLGHSRGGGVALLGAAAVPNLRAVIAWSPIGRCDNWDAATVAQWERHGFMEVVNQRTKQVMRISRNVFDDFAMHHERLDIPRAATELRVPLLVVHGARDESVPLDEGTMLAARARDSSLLIIERASHTFNAIHPLVNVPFELLVAAEASAHYAVAHT